MAVDQVRLIAAHAWDVGAADRAGCATAFVARPGEILDPLVVEPEIVGADLAEVAEAILAVEPEEDRLHWPSMAGELASSLQDLLEAAQVVGDQGDTADLSRGRDGGRPGRDSRLHQITVGADRQRPPHQLMLVVAAGPAQKEPQTPERR